jgi:toxin CcdB
MSNGTGRSQKWRASSSPRTMTQFEVFANPIVRARPSYPFVVVLQADVARGGHERVVAPVAPVEAFPVISGRLTPIVAIARGEFVLMVTSLTAIPARSLGRAIASLADRRNDIFAAVDYLIFGV